MSLAIVTEGLSRRFGRVQAVSDLSLQVPTGAVYAFLGPNGAGKTTTILSLMNLIRPTAGRAEVLGVESRRLGWRALQSIGYVSESQKLPGWMTVGAFLDFCRPLYPSWDDAYCRDLLKRFELPLSHKLSRCSRGMRMKAALISSLAYRPSLLVLDEPFSGLDPDMRDDMVRGISELARAGGRTIFVSSHDLAEVESVADHVGFLRNGRLHASGRLSDILQRFQRVEVRAPREAPLSDWPGEWVQLEHLDGTVRFIDSCFDPAESPRRLRARFGADASWQISALSLRQIFSIVGKGPRQEAPPS